MLGRATGALCRLLLLAVTAVPFATGSEGPSLSINPASAYPGQQVTATGTGFDSCVVTPPYVLPPSGSSSYAPSSSHAPVSTLPVSIHIDEPSGSRGRTLASRIPLVRKDGYYGFTASFPVPRDLSPGQYQIAAECGNPNGGAGVPGEIAYAPLAVTAPPPSSSSNRPPPPSSGGSSGTESSGGGSSGGGTQGPPPTVTVTPTFAPTVVPVPAPTAESSPLGWLVVLVVVAALVAGTALGRRLTRRRSPRSSPPAVHARLRASGPGRVELRRRGPGRSVGIRVEVHEDAGTRVLQRIGEGSRR
jgi:hypothetical protein